MTTDITEAELAELERLESECPAGDLYCEIDGWPVRNGANGSIPYWAESVDDSEGNPYRPYKISFPMLTFIAAIRNHAKQLIVQSRRALELERELAESQDLLLRECNRSAAMEHELAELKRDHLRLRKILSHVPGKIAIQAKEAAGFPNYVHQTGDSR